jgi:energy-coupling factor transport system ATP-binding protein
MLDPLGRHQVVEIMERLNREEGITVINITHYMEEAARADRVVVINDGRIICDDKPKAVFAKVDMLRGIGLEVPQPRELLHELSLLGLDIKSDAISSDECAEDIIDFLKGNKQG